ncbi:MAG: hypothetical protein MK111_13635, partial [Crocosphaera sp.]|uniref:hypothetical protein n=1 Tax=Crocosphaera sp. TaxID=2729996 RepID=UPI002586BA5C
RSLCSNPLPVRLLCLAIADFVRNSGYAYLSNAYLSNAYLSNAYLEGIKWNKYTNWEGVQGLETAKNVPEALREQLWL